MPRTARPWEPGAIYHVGARAHCGAPIFADEESRKFVLRRAARAFRETSATCLAWSVMNNHYHLLVRCDGAPGRTFARLNTAIACRIARARGDRGGVFQNRFFSGICEDDGSLLTRFAYVLGNPLHHRVVTDLGALLAHPWSSLGELLGLRVPAWSDVDAALGVLDPDPRRARERIFSFLVQKAAEWAERDGERLGSRDEQDPMGPDVVAPLGASFPLAPPPAEEEPTPAQVRPVGAASSPGRLGDELRSEGWTTGDLLRVACDLTGAEVEAVLAGGRAPVEADARSVTAHVACDLVRLRMCDAAKALGVRTSALVERRRRGRSLLAALGVTPEEVLRRSRCRIATGVPAGAAS